MDRKQTWSGTKYRKLTNIIAGRRTDTRDQQTKRKCCVSDGGRVSEVEYIYNPRGKEGDSEWGQTDGRRMERVKGGWTQGPRLADDGGGWLRSYCAVLKMQTPHQIAHLIEHNEVRSVAAWLLSHSNIPRGSHGRGIRTCGVACYRPHDDTHLPPYIRC